MAALLLLLFFSALAVAQTCGGTCSCGPTQGPCVLTQQFPSNQCCSGPVLNPPPPCVSGPTTCFTGCCPSGFTCIDNTVPICQACEIPTACPAGSALSAESPLLPFMVATLVNHNKQCFNSPLSQLVASRATSVKSFTSLVALTHMTKCKRKHHHHRKIAPTVVRTNYLSRTQGSDLPLFMSP